ncbi:MAG: hypothetical protein AB8H79_17185 [Myxococcota bacterium]
MLTRILLSCALLAACSDDANDPFDGGPEPDCVPSAAAFESNVLPIVQAKCADCHGETTQFGAPYSLLDYDALVQGLDGERIVDRIVASVADRSMPPATAEPLGHNEFDTLLGWASCGTEHPDWSDGLVASRDVHVPPPNPPAGARAVDLLAPDVTVSPTTLDDYRNFEFTNNVDSDVFIQRIEGVIDEGRVVHHITLQDGGDYLYAWAPGGDAVQFPDGGLRLRPSDQLTLQVHYNNGAGIEGVTDSSGVRLWVSEPQGTEWGLLSPNTFAIAVPPQSTASAVHRCVATEDFEVFAVMPHMHEIGDSFSHVITRAGGTEESLIDLTGWSFEAQYFYEAPVVIRKGDTLTMTCTYDNPNDFAINGGLGTSDEMCFDFIYAKPASASCR